MKSRRAQNVSSGSGQFDRATPRRYEPATLGTVADLCPMCAARDVPEDSTTGFCDRCETRRTHENYVEKNAAAMDVRRQKRRERTAELNAWDAERQVVHRLRKTITPRELPDPEVDPWSWVIGSS